MAVFWHPKISDGFVDPQAKRSEVALNDMHALNVDKLRFLSAIRFFCQMYY